VRPSWDEPIVRVRVPQAKPGTTQRVFDRVCLCAILGGLSLTAWWHGDPTAALPELAAALVVFLAVLFWLASREL
jgi:hypothetical protein